MWQEICDHLKCYCSDQDLWIIEYDFSKFFDSINHGWFLSSAHSRLKLPRHMFKWFREGLSLRVRDKGTTSRTTIGAP
jgi:retron-type reverse transcriptase